MTDAPISHSAAPHGDDSLADSAMRAATLLEALSALPVGVDPKGDQKNTERDLRFMGPHAMAQLERWNQGVGQPTGDDEGTIAMEDGDGRTREVCIFEDRFGATFSETLGSHREMFAFDIHLPYSRDLSDLLVPLVGRIAEVLLDSQPDQTDESRPDLAMRPSGADAADARSAGRILIDAAFAAAARMLGSILEGSTRPQVEADIATARRALRICDAIAEAVRPYAVTASRIDMVKRAYEVSIDDPDTPDDDIDMHTVPIPDALLLPLSGRPAAVFSFSSRLIQGADPSNTIRRSECSVRMGLPIEAPTVESPMEEASLLRQFGTDGTELGHAIGAIASRQREPRP